MRQTVRERKGGRRKRRMMEQTGELATEIWTEEAEETPKQEAMTQRPRFWKIKGKRR